MKPGYENNLVISFVGLVLLALTNKALNVFFLTVYDGLPILIKEML